MFRLKANWSEMEVLPCVLVEVMVSTPGIVENCFSSGVATAEDIDRAVSEGPGPRWALMGPLLTYRLAGGMLFYALWLVLLVTAAAIWIDGPTAALVGRPLRDLRFPDGTIVALIRRQGQSTVPNGSTVLEAGDRITLIGDATGIREMQQTYAA